MMTGQTNHTDRWEPHLSTDRITLLHLSDVHFGMPDNNGDMGVVTSSLIEAAHAANIKPDLCVFTGDLAHSGEKRQVEQGMAWLAEVIAPWGCPLAIVPGNHDLKLNHLSAEVRDHAAEGAAQFNQQRAAAKNKRRFSAFSKASKAHPQALFDWDKNLFYQHARLEQTCLPVNLIGLNSALYSVGNDDEGRLSIDLVGLNTTLNAIDTQHEMTLVLAHHPLDWLAAWNRDDCTVALGRDSKGAHAYLYGHLHDPEGQAVSSTAGDSLVRLAAGSAYQTTKWPMHFAFYTFDLSAKSLTPAIYVYNPRKNAWHLDGSRSNPLTVSLPTPKQAPAVSVSRPTRLPTTPYDTTLQHAVGSELDSPELHLLGPRLLELAAQLGAKGATSAAHLLCGGTSLEWGLLIGLYTQAVDELYQGLSHTDAQTRDAFRGAVTRILGWLLLRTVNPAWLERYQAQFEARERVWIDLRVTQGACVEVLLARGDSHPASLALHGDQIRGGNFIADWAEGGIVAACSENELLRVVWMEVMRSPPPSLVDETQQEKLKKKLRARAASNRAPYVAVQLAAQQGCFSEAELRDFAERFSQLKMVALFSEGEAVELLLDAETLYYQIENFLEVIS